MKIGILVDGFFLNNTSGVNTYVYHLCKLLQGLDHNVSLLLDTEIPCKHSKNEYDRLNVNKIIADESDQKCLDFDNGLQFDINQFIELLDNISDDGFDLIISNSFFTASALKISNIRCRKAIQTHIGDIMSPEFVDKWDFPEQTKEFLELLDDDELELLCQTQSILDRHLSILKNRTTGYVCNEPLFLNELPVKFEQTGVLCIAGNYKRKNIDQVIDMCARAELPLTILTTTVDSVHAEPLDIQCMRKGIQYQILTNQPNKFITNTIKRHRVLLHMADIEVCPYSVIESMMFIPTLIKHGTDWGQDFFRDSVQTIELADHEKLKHVYDNFDKYHPVDIKKYQLGVTTMWNTYLNK